MSLSQFDDLLAVIIGCVGLVGIIWQLSQIKSNIDINILQVKNEVALLNHNILNKLSHDKYRLDLLEIQIQELKNHIDDIEEVLNKLHGFVSRNYSSLEDCSHGQTHGQTHGQQ